MRPRRFHLLALVVFFAGYGVAVLCCAQQSLAATPNVVVGANGGSGSGTGWSGDSSLGLNGYIPPTCTTSSSVSIGGVCEDFSTPSSPVVDTGDAFKQGRFGAFFGWLFDQFFRLVTDNIGVLIFWLGCWLTYVVFSYLGKKSGANDDATTVYADQGMLFDRREVK